MAEKKDPKADKPDTEKPDRDRDKDKDQDPVVLLSDEGVPYQRLDAETIVNWVDPRGPNWPESRRRELHVGGRTYSHVAEQAQVHWIYRHDK